MLNLIRYKVLDGALVQVGGPENEELDLPFKDGSLVLAFLSHETKKSSYTPFRNPGSFFFGILMSLFMKQSQNN